MATPPPSPHRPPTPTPVHMQRAADVLLLNVTYVLGTNSVCQS